MSVETDNNIEQQAQELQAMLDKYKDRRVIVVGTTCTGKTTLLERIESAQDMDELVFPLLTDEEADYVCQEPWTHEIGETMVRLTRERVHVEPGKPVFGTVILDSDLIVYLKINDDLLRHRTSLRNSRFKDAKNMQRMIEAEIEKSGIEKIEYNVG